ncbi:MAG: hypothetical protein GZ094_17030 [Mariniphaga sp.]|nr:hypothetical protein [Mariniphaga sp.]
MHQNKISEIIDRTPSCRVKIDSRPIGYPFCLIGCPFALIGCPFAPIGCPFAPIGCPFALIGCPFVPIGCPFAPIGCPFAPIGCSFAPIGYPFQQKVISALQEGVLTDNIANNSNQGTITINVLSGFDGRETG